MNNIIDKAKNKFSRSDLINILCAELSTTEICKSMNNHLVVREQNYQEKNWFI
jgi:hypothetical protein